MVKSIQHFNEVSVGIFEQVIQDFCRNPKDFDGFVHGILNELHQIGIRLIRETLEEMDLSICESGFRKEEWNIEAHSKKHLLTSLGDVTFSKTFFENKTTGETGYLLDRVLGLEKNERITEDAEAAMLEEAVQTSYRRGGEHASILDQTSKQTVKRKIHRLQFPQQWKAPEKKKTVEYLYIEADEDHVALQFRQKKGDLQRDENGRKNNNVITKLVYVHEGIKPEAPRSKRHKLVNPYYFAGTAQGKSNEEFWKDVYRYIDAQYDLSKIKKIYVNSDGGGWIRAGMRQIKGLVHVLDEHHLDQSIAGLTTHMKDSREDAEEEIRKEIRRGTKKGFEELTEKLQACFPDGEAGRRFEESRTYILSNWTAARYRLAKVEGVVGSSTEGHVSHVLASRMSTKAMGWSLTGADKMAQLRAYYWNGGDMLDLVRYQKQVMAKAAGAENEVIYTSSEMIRQEKKRRDELGKYYESIHHSISLQNRKKIYFRSNLFLY